MRQLCATVCVVLTCGLLGAQAVRPSPSERQDKEAALARRINLVVHKVQQRQLRSDQHTPWVIMHAAIAFKSDAVVFDTASGEEVEAIEFLLTRAEHEGRSLFQVVDDTPTLRRNPAVEHHVDQYLMMLALAGVSPQRALFVDPSNPAQYHHGLHQRHGLKRLALVVQSQVMPVHHQLIQ